MILKSDQTLRPVADFTAQIQTLDIPGENKVSCCCLYVLCSVCTVCVGVCRACHCPSILRKL